MSFLVRHAKESNHRRKEDIKMFPNFFIVGAARSGTTSLYKYLNQHPQVYMSSWKEPSFFLSDPFEPNHRVRNINLYKKIFTGAHNHLAVGEASTCYLYNDATPDNIKNMLGDIKVIIILRNPVDMAFSLYNHQVRKEGERIKTFESALKAEGKRRSKINFRKKCYGWHANYYYFHRGLYSRQVKRYIDCFGRGRVLILLFDELVEKTRDLCSKVYRFLGVDDSFRPEIKVYNEAGKIMSLTTNLYNPFFLIKILNSIMNGKVIYKLKNLPSNYFIISNKSINPTTANKLRSEYLNDICILEKLIGKDLSSWK